MWVCSGPGVPVTGITATWPSRTLSGLMLSTTDGWDPKPSKSTSHTSPRNGSGCGIGVRPRRATANRQRGHPVAVVVIDTAGHALLGGAAMQQLQRCLHNLGPAVQPE